MKLTAAQQDYLEAIYRLEQEQDSGSIRVSDIAERLGTRLPTVSRTVRKLTDAGLLEHPVRGTVSLTPDGRSTAAQFVHRHDDVVEFFRDVLGLTKDEAEENACQIEHGLTNAAAQRLHEFLDFVDSLPEAHRSQLARFARQESTGVSEFDQIESDKTSGWRA
ncbi:MarR family transcriptional regulator [candidate division GN15 bacterium]|nr:MarR family transcriptional regulator [candidate division GN15 bacterium]